MLKTGDSDFMCARVSQFLALFRESNVLFRPLCNTICMGLPYWIDEGDLSRIGDVTEAAVRGHAALNADQGTKAGGRRRTLNTLTGFSIICPRINPSPSVAEIGASQIARTTSMPAVTCPKAA